MSRQIEIVSPTEKTDSLLTKLQRITGVSGAQVQRGASLQPPGDVISISALNRSLPEVCRLLADENVGRDPSSSFSTSEPKSSVDNSSARAIARDSSEATWEEMELVIGKESNMTLNALLVMLVSGVVATVGIATNALHLVIGAMLIAPGFLPIVRVSLGIAGESAAWRRGLVDTFKGYVALALGAASATLALIALGHSPEGGEASYLPAGMLISYWTTITAPALVVSFVSGVIGTILLATGRSVLTAGVMVALALVPSAAIGAMGLVMGELSTAAAGALRWAVDVAIVALTSLAVLVWKRFAVHKRPMLL